MSIGSEFLAALKRLDRTRQHFKYDQYQQLREIDSVDQLRLFLHDRGYTQLDPDGDASALARNVAAQESAKRSRLDWIGWLREAWFAAIAAIIAIVLLAPAVAVNRLLGHPYAIQRTTGNLVCYAILVVLLVFYEVLAGAWLGPDLADVPWRLLLGTLAAAIIGLGFAVARRTRTWIAVAVAILIELELLILAYAWLSSFVKN